MKKNSFTEIASGKTQAMGAFSIDVNIISDRDVRSNENQLTITPTGTTTTGTVAVLVFPYGSTTGEPLTDQFGATIIFNLADQKTVLFDGYITKYTFTPTSVDDTYTVAISAWGQDD